MGYKLKKIVLDRCLEPKPNKEIDIKVHLQREMGAAIHGIVLKHDGDPAYRAVVKLFKKKRHSENHCELIPITFTFTDECGQFLFGLEPLPDCFVYVIKIFYFEEECNEELSEDCEESEEEEQNAIDEEN